MLLHATTSLPLNSLASRFEVRPDRPGWTDTSGMTQMESQSFLTNFVEGTLRLAMLE